MNWTASLIVVLVGLSAGYFAVSVEWYGDPTQQGSLAKATHSGESSIASPVDADALYPIDRPVFSESFDVKEALAVSNNKRISEGQRNEALNALRSIDRPQALVVLSKIIADESETLKFRSWAAQHLGLLGEGCTDSEVVQIIAALQVGLTDVIDGPLWRESVYALSGIHHNKAQRMAREALDSLTLEQRKSVGALIDDVSGRLDRYGSDSNVL